MIDWKDFNFTPVGQRIEVSVDSFAIPSFMKQVLQSGAGVVSRIHHEGYSETAYQKIIDMCNERGGRLIYNGIYTKECNEFLYIFNDAAVYTSAYGKNTTIGMASCNDEITAFCKGVVSTCFTSPAKRGYVFAITRNSEGKLGIQNIGHAGVALEKRNYLPEVIQDYEYVVQDLNSKYPSGRVVILRSIPGMGKSFMIRGLMMDTPNVMHVLVPNTMVASIGGPDLLPLLLQTKQSYSAKGPISLLLEDADECLAPRAADNMSSISSILNLGDGIFGSLFDIRIIATTNTRAKDIDPAILRDGRLSKIITMDPLPYSHANMVYRNLLANNDLMMPRPEIAGPSMKPRNEKTTWSLAEVYKLARDAGWRPDGNEPSNGDDSLIHQSPTFGEETKEISMDDTEFLDR